MKEGKEGRERYEGKNDRRKNAKSDERKRCERKGEGLGVKKKEGEEVGL